MKNFSNTYIFTFSAIMVIIVAAVLSFIAMQLKPIQQQNIKTEQMQSILSAVNIESTTKDAQDKFEEFIVESYVVSTKGEKLTGIDALDVDMKQELDKILDVKLLKESSVTASVSPFKAFLGNFIEFKEVDKSEISKKIAEEQSTRKLPVFVCNKENQKYYIFPLRGKGLWGPIWGYVALESDFNTIFGANFDHKSETPGLGAEINQDWFQAQFKGKKIFSNNKFVSIEVVKGGTDESNQYGVDAISGGTITSKGLEAMLFDCLNSYTEFFKINNPE